MDNTTHTISEALKLVKDNSKEKFDATVELHINLGLDKNQTLRTTATLPQGTGKEVKVAVLASKKIANADLELTEDDLAKIASGDIKPKVDFDILVAEPSFMSKIAKVAMILGPAGVMPTPKTGTVTTDVEAAVTEIKKGQVELRMEKEAPLIHTVLGKVSFDVTALVENYEEIMKTLKQNKPQKAKPDWIKGAYVCSSMGKSVQIELA